jgi:hypothetical protein
MKIRIAVAVVLLLSAGAAWAGRTNYFETSVDTVNKEAYGSLYDTRHSADNVQYIGCYINLIGGVARVNCEARDAASDSLSCGSTNAELVKIAQALSDSSYIFFRCDASYALTYLYVSNNSVWLP